MRRNDKKPTYPTLLALPLFAEVEDNPVTNQNWYTIDYYAVKGY